jgi:hypothetical protein
MKKEKSIHSNVRWQPLNHAYLTKIADKETKETGQTVSVSRIANRIVAQKRNKKG